MRTNLSKLRAQDPAGKAYGESLAYFAVGVGEDIIRVGVNAYEMVRRYC